MKKAESYHGSYFFRKNGSAALVWPICALASWWPLLEAWRVSVPLLALIMAKMHLAVAALEQKCWRNCETLRPHRRFRCGMRGDGWLPPHYY